MFYIQIPSEPMEEVMIKTFNGKKLSIEEIKM